MPLVGRLSTAELVERSFALILDRGGVRRAWLRSRETLHKCYLIHIDGYNLGVSMRLLTGAGTPCEVRWPIPAHFAAVVTPTGGLLVLLILVADRSTAAFAVILEPDHFG
jgi:transposase